jgi:uncharacterized protein
MAAPRLSPLAYLGHLLLLRNGPASPKSWSYHLARALVLFAYLYLGVVVILLFLENRLLFHHFRAAEQWQAPPSGLPVEDVEMTSGDGSRIHAWWSTPPGWKPEDGAVLFCHGNAGNVSLCGWQMDDWVRRRRQAVLAFDYPGFGKSGGSPSEGGCYAAADAAYDYLTQTLGVPRQRVLLYGESLGGAVATDLASRRPCRALILTSTFTSIPDMAMETYPFLPGRWLVCNQFRSVDKIRSYCGPVFMGHGTSDALVPISQGQRLFAAANDPKEFVTMPGLGHDAPTADFYVRCMQFLEEVEKEVLPQTASGN